MSKPAANLCWEEIRLSTFKAWPFGEESVCNIRSMAEAGFYKTDNDEDSAKCFLCGKEMVGWEEDNDPWEEHVSHAPKCLFAQIRKPENMLTIAELFAIMRQYEINLVMEQSDKLLEMCNEVVDKYVIKLKSL